MCGPFISAFCSVFIAELYLFSCLLKVNGPKETSHVDINFYELLVIHRTVSCVHKDCESIFFADAIIPTPHFLLLLLLLCQSTYVYDGISHMCCDSSGSGRKCSWWRIQQVASDTRLIIFSLIIFGLVYNYNLFGMGEGTQKY